MRYLRLLILLFSAATAVGCSPAQRLSLGQLHQTLHQAGAEIVVSGRLAGSGAFVSADGLVLTAAHVVWNKGDDIEVVNPVAGRVGRAFSPSDVFPMPYALCPIPKEVRVFADTPGSASGQPSADLPASVDPLPGGIEP